MGRHIFSLGYFLAAIGASNLAMGLHKVLYPWLVVGVLQESPSRLGLAQMAVLLPNLLFILPAGVVSDRRHRGSWLSFLYLLYLLPIGILTLSVASAGLTFTLLLLFGMVFGTLSAFVQPARESMLGYAMPETMHQTVAKVMVVQFMAQGIGFMVAGQLDSISLTALLCLQMVVFSLSAVLIKYSHPKRPATGIDKGAETQPLPLKNVVELRQGLALFRNNRGLLHLLIVIFSTGFLTLGLYLVGMPLISKEFYHGGAELYAGLQIAFTLGIVSANFAVMKRVKMFRWPGKLMIISFFIRGTLVAVVAFNPSIWQLFTVIYFWGLFSGLSMTLGRTILHNQVPHQLRSRASSVYHLCLFGGAPLGAWVCGLVIELTSLTYALLLTAAITLLVSTLMALLSPLWPMRATEAEH